MSKAAMPIGPGGKACNNVKSEVSVVQGVVAGFARATRPQEGITRESLKST